jgi:hypothetical protein
MVQRGYVAWGALMLLIEAPMCLTTSFLNRRLGAFHHVPHGLSSAMLLSMVSEYSIAAADQRNADCARAKRTQQDVSKPSTTHASNHLCLRGFSSRLP